MAIDKSAVRVGGANALDPISGLPMYRKYITHEGNRETEFIKVSYIQWLESPNSTQLELKSRAYIVRNIEEQSHVKPEISHIIPATGHDDETTGEYVIDVAEQYIIDSPSETIIDVEANTGFTDWFFLPLVAKADGLYIGGRLSAPLGATVCMGKDLIVGAINYTLKTLVHGIEDNHVTQKNT